MKLPRTGRHLPVASTPASGVTWFNSCRRDVPKSQQLRLAARVPSAGISLPTDLQLLDLSASHITAPHGRAFARLRVEDDRHVTMRGGTDTERFL